MDYYCDEDYDMNLSNARARKRATYNSLSRLYEQKLAKYKNASEQYKQTAEYARLAAIVTRLRGTIEQMRQDLSR